MRIQHNISALNAHRQLGSNNSAVAKNLEKLSSGFRINRAGDDAAGLAISEKMRGQIRGLEMASKNAQDGVSLIQTAEGALHETHSILQRMRELSVQASNGTYEEGFDSKQINKEVTALKAEIDRISDSTHFNNQKLLDGSLDGKTGGASSVAAVGIPDWNTGDVILDQENINATKTATFTTGTAVGAQGASMAIGDKLEYSLNFTDAEGKEHNKTITLTVKTQDATAKTMTFTDQDGNEYVAGAAGTPGEKMTDQNLTDLLVDVFSKDADINKSFKVSDNTKKLDFDARTAGSGTYLNSISSRSISATGTITAGSVTTTGIAAQVNAGAKGEDAYTAADVSGVKVFDVTKDKAEDLETITVDGQKFAFVANGTDRSKLSEFKDVTFVEIAAAGAPTTIDVADVTELAKQIKTKTGYDVKTGDNVAAGNAGTYLHFKADPNSPVANKANSGITFQIGANGTADDRVSLSVANQDTKTLKIDAIDLSTQDGANAAITLLDDAINSVSSTRADLGALQNRLEHTINNLGTSVENLTASESRIRDVDMAKEMMEMTKNNILTQAAQSMLAQANTQPQGVLQLLQ